MQTNTPIDVVGTTKRPWWLLLSFGITLILFVGMATCLGHMLYEGLEYLIDNFGVMGEDFWIGVCLVVGSPLLFVALAVVVVSELRTVFGKSVTAAINQAKVWQQARRIVVFCMALIALSPLFLTVIPGSPVGPICTWIGAFLTLWYVSSTHAKWSSLLQRNELETQSSRV